MAYKKFLFVFMGFLFLFAAPVSASAGHPEVDLPFRQGESLTFEIKWAFITAGYARLQVRDKTRFEGIDAYHFDVKAWTTSFVDNIYKVRDYIDAYVDEDITHSLYYRKKEREGDHRGEVRITFDWKNNQARYHDLEKSKDPILIKEHTFDPLSIFYYFRLHDLKPGSVFQGIVTDGKKSVLGRASVIRRETIEVEAGNFDTYLVEPELKEVGGVFKKSKKAKLQVWVTADQYKVPIKIRSKVVVGYFTAELLEYSGVDIRPLPEE